MAPSRTADEDPADSSIADETGVNGHEATTHGRDTMMVSTRRACAITNGP